MSYVPTVHMWLHFLLNTLVLISYLLQSAILCYFQRSKLYGWWSDILFSSPQRDQISLHLTSHHVYLVESLAVWPYGRSIQDSLEPIVNIYWDYIQKWYDFCYTCYTCLWGNESEGGIWLVEKLLIWFAIVFISLNN